MFVWQWYILWSFYALIQLLFFLKQSQVHHLSHKHLHTHTCRHALTVIFSVSPSFSIVVMCLLAWKENNFITNSLSLSLHIFFHLFMLLYLYLFIYLCQIHIENSSPWHSFDLLLLLMNGWHLICLFFYGSTKLFYSSQENPSSAKG